MKRGLKEKLIGLDEMDLVMVIIMLVVGTVLATMGIRYTIIGEVGAGGILLGATLLLYKAIKVYIEEGNTEYNEEVM